MAEGIKISEMTEVTGLLGSDLIPLVSEGQNRKIAIDNLRKALFPIGCKIVSSINPSTWIGGTWSSSNITYSTPNYTIRHISGSFERWELVETGQDSHNLGIYEWTRTA